MPDVRRGLRNGDLGGAGGGVSELRMESSCGFSSHRQEVEAEMSEETRDVLEKAAEEAWKDYTKAKEAYSRALRDHPEWSAHLHWEISRTHRRWKRLALLPTGDSDDQ